MPPLPFRSGVYKITNTKTGRLYVGSAATCLKTRLAKHRYDLDADRHDNGYLQRSWNKHGPAAFRFEVIERCPPELCVEREQYWIDKLRAADRAHGYNLAPTAGSMLGYRHTDEGRAKISEATTAAMNRPEVREKIADGQKRRTARTDWQKKVSTSCRANWQDPEWRRQRLETLADPDHRAKLSAAQTERMNRPENIEKYRQIMNKRWDDPEFRDRISAKLRGRTVSAEARAKMKAAKRRAWDDPVRKLEMLRKRRQTRAANRQQALDRARAARRARAAART